MPYPFQDVSEMPERRGSGTPGRWDWLRDMIIDELRESGKARRFKVPNKKEARLLQSSAQNTSSTVKTPFGKQLPRPYKVRTATEPVNGKEGAFYVWVQVYKP